MMDDIFTNRRRLKLRLFFEGIIVGSVTGTIVAAFRFLLDEADIYRPIWLGHLKFDVEISSWLITVAAIFLIAAFIARSIVMDGQIAGSGVPQIKGILQGTMSMTRPIRLIVIKFIAAVLGIGAGMSLGRAGLSVQFGACVGNFFNKILGRPHVHHDQTIEPSDVVSFETTRSISTIEPLTIEGKFLLTAGAGAGLAAIFNAPLAGVIFCVEELHKRFSSELLLVSMTAAISASAVVELVFGVRPVFETITPSIHSTPLVSTLPTLEMISTVTAAPLTFTMYFAMLGAFTGVLGAMFTKSLLMSLDAYDRIGVKGTARYLIPLTLAVLIGLYLPEVLGCGNVLVDYLLKSHFTLSLLLIFFVGKFAFTMICFGTGAPGGIFLPLLVLGALSGEIFASVASTIGLFGAEWTTLFVIFGMAGYFAAVVKAPITGSVLIMELTGSFTHLLALIIVSGVSFLVSDICGGSPAYSALLNRSLKR